MKCAKCNKVPTRMVQTVDSGWGIACKEYEFRCDDHKLTPEDKIIIRKKELRKRP